MGTLAGKRPEHRHHPRHGYRRGWGSSIPDWRQWLGRADVDPSDPATGVECDLSLEDGKYLYAAALRYTPMTGATKVTWSMHGDVGFDLVARYFGLFSDSLAGPMFTQGLENLKTTVEGS